MSEIKIKFKSPTWVMLLFGWLKKILDGLVLLGVGGNAVDSNYQFTPVAVLVFFALRMSITYFFQTLTSQKIVIDDDK